MPRIEVAAKVSGEGLAKGWYAASFPRSVSAALGARGATRVVVTLAGRRFRTSVFPNGDGTHHLMVNRAMREAAGIRGDGAKVRLTLERDAKPRTVRQPPELRAALAGDAKARAFYAALPPSHKKAYADYIAGAKQPATRARRAARSAAMLARGERRD